jgi:hypothetical protein
LTNVLGASTLHTLQQLGLTEPQLKKLLSDANSGHQTVTLRLSRSDGTSFVRETTREVESATKTVTEVKSSLLGSLKATNKVITKVTEYFWKFDAKWAFSIYTGTT